MKNSTIKVGDVYYRQEPETQKYFAFQITEDKGGLLVYLLLDYFKDIPPTERDLHFMKPFINTRWWLKNSFTYNHARTKDFPSKAMYVGNIKPLETKECNSYSGWCTGFNFINEIEWNSFPEETRRRFKEALDDTSEFIVAGIEARRSWNEVDDELLSAMTDYVKELYELPVANSFVATKYYPQLIPFLETRHTAASIDWTNHGQKELDLSTTHLRNVTIRDKEMILLKLPTSCTELKLRGTLHPDLKIEAYNNGQKLTIVLDLLDQNNRIPNLNVVNLKCLKLLSINTLDLIYVSKYYTNLRHLLLIGKPGYVENISSLSNLKKLSSLYLEDIFGFTGEEFPKPEAFPHINDIYFDSIPEEAGKYIKKIYKGKLENLDVKKLRNTEWLAENLDNPLRHWDGSEFITKSNFKKSVLNYRDTRRAVLDAVSNFKINKDSDKLQKCLEQISVKYVETFNKLDKRTGWIETEEREDICAAFDIILKDAQELIGTKYIINSYIIYDIMNDHRDW